MTYKYGNTDQHDCLYNAARAYPGGIPALAHRMEMNPKLLYKKLSPMERANNSSFEDATIVMELCQSAAVDGALSALDAMAFRLGKICIDIPNITDGDIDVAEIQRLVFKAMSQLGDAVSASTDALVDGHLSEQEMAEIEPKLRALLPTICNWLHRMRSRAKSDSNKLLNRLMRKEAA